MTIHQKLKNRLVYPHAVLLGEGGKEIMMAVIIILEDDHLPKVKEQVSLCYVSGGGGE